MFADNPPTSDDTSPTRPDEAAQNVPTRAAAAPPAPSPRGNAGEGGPPAGSVSRAARLRRWRTPAQWAALAALVAVLVIANHIQNSDDRLDTASPLELLEQSATPAEPSSFPTGPMAPEEVRPTSSPSSRLPSSAPPSSAPSSSAKASTAPERSRPRGGGAGIVLATSSRLYRITADAQVEEYTSKTDTWTVIRKRTERIFTSPTTLYATDGEKTTSTA